ncbi:MAG: DUF748 domain-containing protein [Alcanivoracaceae bacterium]|nr:DUF748 domain-containing protein [Alcanivoracaceae bacterium]
MAIREWWQRAGRRQRIGAVAGAAYLAYVLLGWLVLSPLVRKEVVSVLSEQLGREVVLEHFTFNPLGLAITAEGFAIRDPHGADLVAFDELYVDFELSSLLRWSWHFDEISLVKPRIHVTRLADESLSFDDILNRVQADSAAQDESPGQAKKAGGIPRISIGELSLQQGNFTFRDEARTTPDDIAFNNLTFHILDFSTASDGEDKNSYRFEITGPDGGHFLWDGNFRFDPLVAEGQLALSGLRLEPLADFAGERINFAVPEGELDIRTRYRYEAADDLVLSLSEGVIGFRDLEIVDRRNDETVITIPELVFDGMRLDTVSQQAGIGMLRVREPQLVMTMNQQGLDLASLFVPLDPPPVEAVAESDAQLSQESADETVGNESVENGTEATATEAADNTPVTGQDVADADGESGTGDTGNANTDDAGQPGAEAAPWQLLVDAVSLQQADITYRDLALREPGELRIAPLNLNARNLSPNDNVTFTFDGDAVVAEQAQLSLQGDGELSPLRVSTALTLDNMALSLIEPWLRDGLDVRLPSGVLASTLSINVSEQEEDIAITVSGDQRISNFALTENDQSPIMSFADMQLSGLALDTATQQVTINMLAFDQLALTTVTDGNGTMTADRIVVPVAAAAAGATPSAGDGADAAWQVRLADLRINNGTVEAIDQALSPNFRIGVHQLNLRMSNLDSTSRTPAQLDMQGKVDKYAPLAVKGTLNPLAAAPQVNLDVSLQGYEMTSLTPFTGQYLGYTVSSGQLGVQTKVLLDNTFIDCRNQIAANNFFLGEKVESKDAIKAPIKLGLSVLRDASGMISLPVNASGDLNDPSISVSGVILKALTNVLVKAATSPFSVLAGLAGGEDLSHVPFIAGTDQLDVGGRQNLQALVEVMNKRPTLRFSLSGSVTDDDRTALAAAALGAEIQGSNWQGIDAALADAGARRRIVRRYEESTGTSADALLPALAPDATDEQRQLAQVEQARAAWTALVQGARDTVTADQLQALAAARAQVAKTVLVEQLQMDAQRLFIANPLVAGDDVTRGVVLGLAGE